MHVPNCDQPPHYAQCQKGLTSSHMQGLMKTEGGSGPGQGEGKGTDRRGGVSNHRSVTSGHWEGRWGPSTVPSFACVSLKHCNPAFL